MWHLQGNRVGMGEREKDWGRSHPPGNGEPISEEDEAFGLTHTCAAGRMESKGQGQAKETQG